MPTKPRSRCPNCKTLHPGTGLCPHCRRAAARRRSARRGTTTQRGLGADHRKAAALVLAGATVCAICGKPPTRNDPLTAGHIIAREDGGTNDPSNYQAEHRSCNSRKRSPHRQVVLVTGPPCAGKSTYVRTHAQPDDLILDLDEIARECGSTRYWQHDPAIAQKADRIMRSRIASLAGGGSIRAWVIRCAPSGPGRSALARLIRADQVIVLLPDSAELVRRALQRPDRIATINAINAWREAYTPADQDTLITGS